LLGLEQNTDPMSKKRRRRRHLREGDSLTIDEFCRKHGIARSTFYKLRKAGDGPAEIDILGTVRISAGANSEWVVRKEKERAARLPVFAPKSPGPDEESRDDKTVPERPKKRSKKPGREPASESAGRDDDRHSDGSRINPGRQEGRSKKPGRERASESSRSDKHRDNDKTSPRRRKRRSKEHGHGKRRSDDDETVRRRKRRWSKEWQRARSEKAGSGDVRPVPQLDIAAGVSLPTAIVTVTARSSERCSKR
jgi:predicted DNA-binding transcriptional regulator AlpA